MKRKLSLVLVLTLVLTFLSSSIAHADTATDLSKREKAIVKAYVKTVETGDLKYLNKYKYPGMTYQEPGYAGLYNVKIISPKYSKKYIKSEKLYCLYVTGTLVVSEEDYLVLAKMRIGIYIKKKGNTAYAYLEKQTDGKDIYADQIITVDKLSKSAITELEKYLVGLYGEENGKALMYPDSTEEIKSTEFQSDDGKESLTAPSTWTNYEELSDDAILHIADRSNERYLIVLKETKEYFSEDMSLNDYTEAVKSRVVGNVENASIGDMEELEVNGNNAQCFIMSGEYSKIKITYIFMCIETSNDFYMIMGWTPTMNFSESKDEILEIMKSFKETE